MVDVHYCRDPKLVELIPGARDSLIQLRNAGYKIIIVTNQSAIGRGWMTLEEYHAVAARFEELVGPGLIDGTYFAQEAPEVPSDYRKPAPGMLLEAAASHGIDLSRSWMIGDKAADVQAGIRAGARSILVRTGHGQSADATGAAYVAEDLPTAVRWITKGDGKIQDT